MKILVVEDDGVQRGVIAAMLTASGHEVTEAESGEAAVSLVGQAKALDLVLMDLRLPGIGGREALECIRALPGWRGRVPVQAMSARSLSVGDGAAFDGFVSKGMDIAPSLAAAVAETMARAAARPNAFAAWMRANWGWLGGCLVMLGTGAGVLMTNSAANAKFDLRLTQVEAGLQRGEARDGDSQAALGRAIADLGKGTDSRSQDGFNTLKTAIGELAKHSDGRETEIFQSLNKDLGDVAGRIDAQDKRFNELRHIRDLEQAAMMQRIAVLESQLRFFADRFDVSSRPPVAPLPVPGKHR